MKAKKIMTAGLAAVFALSLTVPVMADTSPVVVESETGSVSFDVMSSISKGAASDVGTTDYYVNITWSNTPGSYTIAGDTYAWDAGAKSYVRTSQKTGMTSIYDRNGWAEAAITITNQSNADVDYEITYANYTGTTQTYTWETTSDSSWGTLESFVTKNSIDITSDNSGAASIDYALSGYTADSVTYSTKIGLSKYKSDNYSSDAVKLGTFTITISKTAVASYTLSDHTATTLTSTALLQTDGDAVTYTYDGATCKAYNGYISATSYAGPSDAIAFVNELNGLGTNQTKILPAGVSKSSYAAARGSWRLLSCSAEVYAWATATTGEESGFGNVNMLLYGDGSDVLWWDQSGQLTYYSNVGRAGIPSLGFVVVWTN